MKHTMLLILLLCSPMLIIAQEQSLSSVPVLAGKHLQTNYPEAIVLDWIRLTPDHIAARFLMNEQLDLTSEAIYTNQGLWIRTQSDSQLSASLINSSQQITTNHHHAIVVNRPEIKGTQ